MLMAILVQTMVPPLGVVWKYANWPEVFIVIVRMKKTVLNWCYIIIYIYTLMAPFSLCWRRWYISHIHHFAGGI